MASHGTVAPELATLQSGLLVDYRAGNRSTATRKWIHLHIGRTVRATLGPPKQKRSIFRTLRRTSFPKTIRSSTKRHESDRRSRSGRDSTGRRNNCTTLSYSLTTGLRPDEDLGKTILEIEVRGKHGVGYCKSMPGAVRPFERRGDVPVRVAVAGFPGGVRQHAFSGAGFPLEDHSCAGFAHRVPRISARKIASSDSRSCGRSLSCASIVCAYYSRNPCEFLRLIAFLCFPC